MNSRLRTALLPARLHDAGDLSLERQCPETQATDTKLPQVSPRASAELAPVVFAGAELRLPRVLHSLCSGCHKSSKTVLSLQFTVPSNPIRRTNSELRT